MKPFFLRRLKADVLTDLPKKVATLEKVSMSEKQSQIYYKLVSDYKERAARVGTNVFKIVNEFDNCLILFSLIIFKNFSFVFVCLVSFSESNDWFLRLIKRKLR